MYEVAPFVGAWIEISLFTFIVLLVLVAPFVGAWIEMHIMCYRAVSLIWSLRSSERGLK